jgi:hypothetical protein
VRKLADIAFILLFLLFSGGVQILVHTCGGRTSVKMMPSSAEDPCGCGDESPDSHCCSVELRSFQLDAMQQAMAPSFPKVEPLAVPELPLLQDLVARQTVVHTVTATPSPPRSVSTTILNCSFLI